MRDKRWEQKYFMFPHITLSLLNAYKSMFPEQIIFFCMKLLKLMYPSFFSTCVKEKCIFFPKAKLTVSHLNLFCNSFNLSHQLGLECQTLDYKSHSMWARSCKTLSSSQKCSLISWDNFICDLPWLHRYTVQELL